MTLVRLFDGTQYPTHMTAAQLLLLHLARGPITPPMILWTQNTSNSGQQSVLTCVALSTHKKKS